MYEKGEFQTDKDPSKLTTLFGARKKALSIETMQKIEKVLQLIKGTDCTACGAPDCRTFAEDVVRGEAKLNDCVNIVDK
jgi:Na+-translocating ferredoxin:NAD+ oxidoreductase RNF subunit RnfB